MEKILDLGMHPYADSFIAEDQLHLPEPVYPLELYLDKSTGLIKNGIINSANDRYNQYKYSYTSSNSKTSRDHWDSYASYVKEKYPEAMFVVEVGSNDGYLIGQFENRLGIDISKEMVNIANKNAIPTVLLDFTFDNVKRTFCEQKVDIIIANNVLNHANDPFDFVAGVSALLSDNGTFIFEVPCWGEMIRTCNIDMVYHEHTYYYTLTSINNLLQTAGLVITDYSIVNYHGKSFRVECKKYHEGIEPAFNLTLDLMVEDISGLFDVNHYKQVQETITRRRNEWLIKFYSILMLDPDAVIIGVGAAAKANTWLNWHRLDKTLINCITDSSEYKLGKYTPLSRIPIVSDEEFAKHESPYALIMSWNIGEELKKKILEINPNTRFITQ